MTWVSLIWLVVGISTYLLGLRKYRQSVQLINDAMRLHDNTEHLLDLVQMNRLLVEEQLKDFKEGT